MSLPCGFALLYLFNGNAWRFPHDVFSFESQVMPTMAGLAIAADIAYMRQALALAQRAEDQGEVPVGALVVFEGAVIGEGWNQSISTHDPTAHAEMVALRAAASRHSNYRLTGASLYVTLEPCPMCAGAMVQARVARVIYGSTDPIAGAAGTVFNILAAPSLNHRPEVQGGMLTEECTHVLKSFFRARRL